MRKFNTHLSIYLYHYNENSLWHKVKHQTISQNGEQLEYIFTNYEEI